MHVTRSSVIDVLSSIEMENIKQILDAKGVAGPIRLDYYNFARELKKRRDLGQLLEKYQRLNSEILKEIANVIGCSMK